MEIGIYMDRHGNSMSNLCRIDENLGISLTWDSMSARGVLNPTSPLAIPPPLPPVRACALKMQLHSRLAKALSALSVT